MDECISNSPRKRKYRQIMNLVKIEDEKPQIGEWYLVKCWDWCESGYAVAQWDGDTWLDNSGREDFNEYVTHYFDTPIEEI